MKNKKFLFLFGGFFLAFLFLAKTSSLAQTPTVCPIKPSGFNVSNGTYYWSALWTNNYDNSFTGSVKKTSGATSTSGYCSSSWNAYLGSAGYPWNAWTYSGSGYAQQFCGCNNVGFKAYNQKAGCPETESDEFTINFGGCVCSRADFNSDNRVNATDGTAFNSLYASCLNCTPWTCSWLTCGVADLDRNGRIDASDNTFFSRCDDNEFCWCGARPPSDVPAYVCEGQYFGQPQCKAKAVPRSQGACVLEPKWGKIDPGNLSSSINYWKWTYCYPKGKTPVSVTPAPNLTPTAPPQKVCEGKYFGEPQCRAKVTPKPGYSCQLNSVLGTINPTKLSDPINYWKWSYCNN